MSYFYSFHGVEDPPHVPSVIFPSNEYHAIDQVETFHCNMTVVEHVCACADGAVLADDVIQVFATQDFFTVWKTADRFLNSMCRFAQYKGYPNLIYLSCEEGMAYSVDPITRMQTCLGPIAYREDASKAEAGSFTIVYGDRAQEIGHIPVMKLGCCLAGSPGLAECRDSRIPMETVMKIKASGKTGAKQ